MKCPPSPSKPLAHIYKREGEDFGQNIGDNARCYWEHPWGTYWEPIGNEGKMKKILLFTPAP